MLTRNRALILMHLHTEDNGDGIDLTDVPAAIPRMIKRLRTDGHIRLVGNVALQRGAPRKLYSITETGFEALVEFAEPFEGLI